jgi:hypothetical protein
MHANIIMISPFTAAHSSTARSTQLLALYVAATAAAAAGLAS